MPAGTYNIVADAGADYLVTFTYEDTGGTPIDLAGYTASMTFAPQFGSSELLLELTTATVTALVSGGAQVIPVAGGILTVTTSPITDGFYPAGTIVVVSSIGAQSIGYTGLDSSDFTGCTGGTTATLASDALVSQVQGGIVITPLAGQLACTITHEQTTALWQASPSGDWMLTITGGGVITRLVQGAYTVNAAAPSGT
jgi:hypothetical protein